GNAVWTVLQHPEELAQLAADPSLLAGAFDESLRLTSPARLAARRVAEDMVVHGRALRRGDVVLTLFGAANRDPRKFADPDRFDLRRQGPRHLAFGYGPHVCLGAAIGRLQGEIVLDRLLRSCRGLRVAVDLDALRWKESLVLHGLEE